MDPAESSRTNTARWMFILAQLGVCFILVYASAFGGWKMALYYRYLVLIPLYQAAAAFGWQGGIHGGIVSALLFIPLLPIDPVAKQFSYGQQSAVVMVLFITGFGIFVGGTIGRSRGGNRMLTELSRIPLEIEMEPDERSAMKKLAREARALVGARAAAAVLCVPGEAEVNWPVYTDGPEDEAEGVVGELPARHPLLWSAAEGKSLVTSGVPMDPRFDAGSAEGGIKSVMSLPVATPAGVCGALLLADKAGGERFSDWDVSTVELLARAAGAAVHNLRQERARMEEKLRAERMRDVFSRYVSASVAGHLIDNPESFRESRRTVTVLVSDLRGFTSISESLTPEQIVAQLNEYFTEMVGVIFKNGGTVDKYIGDCIIAYWGAPLPDDEHAAHAATAALGMKEALVALNARWAEEGRREFRSGIALHTCELLFGNIGGERKKAFTIIGGGLDRAMRLEAATKGAGSGILMSEAAAAAAGAGFDASAFETAEWDGAAFELKGYKQ